MMDSDHLDPLDKVTMVDSRHRADDEEIHEARYVGNLVKMSLDNVPEWESEGDYVVASHDDEVVVEGEIIAMFDDLSNNRIYKVE